MPLMREFTTETFRLAARRIPRSIERRYADYRRMIDEVGPAAVYAIGPPDVMYPIWTWCLERGLNLFERETHGAAT